MSTKFTPAGPPRFAHQKRGLKRLIQQRGIGALLLDPGLGKTCITIDYLSVKALKRQGEVRVLVVGPLVAIDSWVYQMGTYVPDEINYWAEALGGTLLQKAETLASRGGNAYGKPLDPKRKGKHVRGSIGRSERAQHYSRAIARQTRPDVDPMDGPDALGDGPRIVMEVINTEALSQRHRVGSRTVADILVEAIKRFNPDVCVVDESHRIKSARGNASKLLARVAPSIPNRIILTGTVMPTSPMDVFAQWRFLDNYAFGTQMADGTRRQATFGKFQNRYAQMGGWMGKEIVGYQRLDEMQDIMAKTAIIAKKEDSLDLPPIQDVTLRVELSAREKKAYEDMRTNLAAEIDADTKVVANSMLTKALRLRQITSGYLPDTDDPSKAVRELGSSKVDTIKSLIQDTLVGEKRIVVFALFTHEIQMLTKALADKDTELQVITGGTPIEERIRMRKRFGSDDPQRIVMVAQIKTMSLAVNELVTASHAVFASMSQQRDDIVQARDRLNRIGQTKPVTFWNAVAPGTVDEVIMDTHAKRGDLEGNMLAHIRHQSL